MGYYLRFPRVLLGIEHVRLDSAELEHPLEQLGGIDVGCTDKHRPSLLRQGYRPLYHCVELCPLGLVYEVVLIVANYRTVGRDNHHVKLVDAPEFACLGFCGTCHSGELVVHSEVVLQRYGCESLCGGLDLDVFLGLDCLVQTVTPAASFHDTAG